MGIAVVVRCKLPRPSRKRPSTRWAAVFGRWLLSPPRASALFCVRARMALATWGSALSVGFRCRLPVLSTRFGKRTERKFPYTRSETAFSFRENGKGGSIRNIHHWRYTRFRQMQKPDVLRETGPQRSLTREPHTGAMSVACCLNLNEPRSAFRSRQSA